MIDKNKLLNLVVTELGRAVEQMDQATDAQRLDVSKQEGAMQSRYDTHRIEGSWLADAMQVRRDELTRQLRLARSYRLADSAHAHVCEGSLAYLLIRGNRAVYFVLPFAAGHELVLDGEEVTVVSPDSPLARELLGKVRSDRVAFRGQIVELEDVK